MTDGPDLVPELDLARIRRYCGGRIPARVARLVRLDLREAHDDRTRPSRLEP